jgi:hypothetical protein
MPAPTTPPNPALDFHALAARALTCCQEWRKWAQREPKDSAQARRAFEVAALFEYPAAEQVTAENWEQVRSIIFKLDQPDPDLFPPGTGF